IGSWARIGGRRGIGTVPWLTRPTINPTDHRPRSRFGFDHLIVTIHLEVFERADDARRPADHDFLHLLDRTDADQDARVVGPLEAVASLALAVDRPLAG